MLPCRPANAPVEDLPMRRATPLASSFCLLVTVTFASPSCTDVKPASGVDPIGVDGGVVGLDAVHSDAKAETAGGDAVADAVADAAPVDTYVPEEGEFGWPCTQNAECNSGWCVPTKQGKVCTKTCVESCPDGWNCRPQVAGDPVFLCLPRWLHICDPCEEATDCTTSEADTGHYCLDHGAEGKFCGGECESDGKCPGGFECKPVPVGPGQITPQCVPVGGASCTCSPLAIDFQLQTTCVVSNEFGACAGMRACTVDGLSDCDAKTPIAELCNGVDDDCDGATDNLPPDYQCFKTNDNGTCSGKGQCIGGVEVCDAPDAQPDVCDGLDNDCNGVTDDGAVDTDGDGQADCVDEDDDDDTLPDVADNCPLVQNLDQADNDGDGQGDACDPDDDNDSSPDTEDCAPLDGNIFPGSVEKCDGIDNDCNGQTDDNLCDDGNPCTEGSCNADGSCAQTPVNGIPCDDGTACTQTDVCSNGECLGSNPLICDDMDGNDCTISYCDANVGCLSKLADPGTACEDGQPCIVGTTCNSLGQCGGGLQKAIATEDVGGCIPASQADNPCVAYQCVGSTGQCLTLNQDGVSCSDNSSICKVGGTCKGGQCDYSNKNGFSCTGEYSGAVPDCNQALCESGACTLQTTPNAPCTAEYGLDLCQTVEAQGTCTQSGSCVVTEPPPGYTCPGCNGICIQCFIQFCLPL